MEQTNPLVKSPQAVGIVLGLILGAGAFWYLTDQPKKDLAALESQLQNAKSQASRMATTGTPVSADEEKAWKEASAQLDAKLLPAVESGALLLDLYNVSRTIGLKDVSVSADAPEQSVARLSYAGRTMNGRALPAGLQVQRVRVTGVGDYPAMMRYLRELEKMKPVVEVRGFAVRQEDTLPSFDLQMWAYFKTAGQK